MFSVLHSHRLILCLFIFLIIGIVLGFLLLLAEVLELIIIVERRLEVFCY